MKNNKIFVQNIEVSIKNQDKNDFISLTDIARAKGIDFDPFPVYNRLDATNRVFEIMRRK
jgi:hypothetical protein